MFGWLDGVKRAFAIREVRLAGGNATRERKECVERTGLECTDAVRRGQALACSQLLIQDKQTGTRGELRL